MKGIIRHFYPQERLSSNEIIKIEWYELKVA